MGEKPTETTETYTQSDILEALDDVQDRIAGIRYILEQGSFEDVTVNSKALAEVAFRAGRVHRRRGC